MKKLFSPFSRVIAKAGYIIRLIVSTPQYMLIISLQFVSGVFNVAGLPMLIPVLNYMQGTEAVGSNDKILRVIEQALVLVGIEPNFYSILTIASVLILSGQFLVFVSTLIATNSQVELSAKYRLQLFEAYGKASWLWLIDNRSGEMNYAVIREADIASVSHLNAQRILIFFIQVVVLLFIAVKLSLTVTLVAAGIYSLLAVMNSVNAVFVRKLALSYHNKLTILSNNLNVLQQNKKFFKTSLLNSRLIKIIAAILSNMTTVMKRQNMYIELQQTWSMVFTLSFLLGLMFFHKQLALGYAELLLILLIFLRLAPYFSSFTNAYANLNTTTPLYDSLQNRLSSLRKNEEENSTEEFKSIAPIKFENVNFSYPGGINVFNNLNVAIEPNKTTAFIGSSGAGKSTLLDLMLGLLKPSEGRIIYGDISHDKLDKNSFRRRVAYVGQETTLIDGTLRDNLTIITPGVNDDKLEMIMERVGLTDTVKAMPRGLDTYIGENGGKLSGGQRQRVALARALVMEPDILILDEAASSLDAQTERLIQDTIRNLQRYFTIIVVTHKLSAVRFADNIYVLDQGSVCESGSYEQLLKQKGKLYLFDSLQH